jgi:hypothetical protein
MAIDPKARFTSIESWRAAVHDTLAHEVAETSGRAAHGSHRNHGGALSL